MILTYRLNIRRPPRKATAGKRYFMMSNQALQLPLDLAPSAALDWLAQETRHWLTNTGLEARDAIVLLPQIQLLPAVRDAFARLGGWQPQVDTLETWALRRGSGSAEPAPGADPGRDLTHALLLLQTQPWADEMATRRPEILKEAAAELVQSVAQLVTGAQVQAPQAAQAYWAQVQGLARGRQGQGAWHHGLLQLAVRWAMQSAESLPTLAPAAAVLPAAWVCLQVGGPDAGLQALVNAHPDVPTLRINADADATDPFAAFLQCEAKPVWKCGSLETEAHATLTALVQALAEHEGPVALVAQDRLLTRRVRALLERAGVSWIDETGWRLSTTQAAASVMSWLRAAAAPVKSDAWLEWLKSGACPAPQARALVALEAHWRDAVRLGPTRGLAQAPPALVVALQDWAEQTLEPLRVAGPLSLRQWLMRLGCALHDCGQLDALFADEAGAKVMTALRLKEATMAALQDTHAPVFDNAEDLKLELDGFARWVDGVLEQHHFTASPAAAARVVFLPLEQALLRPFAAVVVPAADAAHLGSAAVSTALLGDAEAKLLGLPHAQQRLQQQALSFAQLLRCPQVQFIYREFVEGEPQRPCPWLVWWDLKRRQAQAAPLEFRSWSVNRRLLQARPAQRPAPVATQALPTTLSASAAAALRVCPYRFFVQYVLRLRPAQELDDAGDGFKRDYGTWLHETLLNFHRQRRLCADDAAALLAEGEALLQAWRVPESTAVPMRASFKGLVPEYLQWLRERDKQGWVFADGERALLAPLPGLPDVMLKGILDRIDERAETPAARQLLDYKTTAKATLSERVKTPVEDTQLAFYALLAQLQLPAQGELSAAYLTIDGKEAPALVTHAKAAESALALQEGLVMDISRLRAGHGLPALGAAASCDHCDARGLCRRDEWDVE
jgi:ATP-dependent helicase/nuclease subunit B